MAVIQSRDPLCLGLLYLRSAIKESINYQNLQLSETLPVKKNNMFFPITHGSEKFQDYFKK